MSATLYIDGYNLLHKTTDEKFIFSDFDNAKENLIDKLSLYKKTKRIKINVIFDGNKTNNLNRNSENIKGVSILYTKGGEEADDILKNLAREKGKNISIVTSDNAIINVAEHAGTVVIKSDEFLEILDFALYMDIKGVSEEDEDITQRGTVKKGPSKRASKKERKKKQVIKKLK